MTRFSVVIPTRDRHETLRYAVGSALAQRYPDVEIIVHDNSSSDHTRDLVSRIDDHRLRYFRTDRVLPMHENWEQALDRTEGDYVLFIGDDDGLMPNSLEHLAQVFDRLGSWPLVTWHLHNYSWPDHADPLQRNLLTLNYEGMTQQGLRAQIDRFMSFPFAQPGDMELLPEQRFFAATKPRFALRGHYEWFTPIFYSSVYHGCVSRKLIERVKARQGGRYFIDPLPDFGSVVSNLSCCDEEILYSGLPFSLSGHSGKSNGGVINAPEQRFAKTEIFLNELGQSIGSIMPSGNTGYLGATAVNLATYENMRNRLFPEDAEIKINWERFLVLASRGVIVEPESQRGDIRERILTMADYHGVPRDRLDFSDAPHFKRTSGPSGGTLYIDGWRAGLNTLDDALALVDSMTPPFSAVLR